MTKETAKLQPGLWQILRSIKPYFGKTGSELKGVVNQSTTRIGQKFWIYLPPNYRAAKGDFPVLYHLHGAAVGWSWVKHDIHWIAASHEQAAKNGDVESMIIVAPHDASKFSMWSDSRDGSNDVASQFINELIPHIDVNYKTRTTRNTRFIQGFSMGGYGAAMLGLKYQKMFAAITIFDGAMHDWSTISTNRRGIARKQFGNNESFYREWSPWVWAERTDLTKTPVLIVDGLLVDFSARYAAHLRELGGNVKILSPNCLHDLACLEATCGTQSFEFMNASVSDDDI